MKYIIILLFSLAACSSQAPSNTDKSPKDQQTKKPKNIIFMIGDGMGLTQITAGMYASGKKLALEKCKYIGLIKTDASDKLITDSAAGATAFSCGKKTYNGAIAVDAINKQPLKTILEMAEEKNFTTGLVVTSYITHATPASYFAHQPSRNMYEEIAMDLLNADVDVAIGGGKNHFNSRKDSADLLKSFREKGYTVADNYDASKPIEGKFLGFISDDQPQKFSEGRGDFLRLASARTVEYLAKQEHPFFVMIEGSQIDWGGHANDSEYIIKEMIDFDKTIAEMLAFAEKDGETLVVITADHETGGYAITEGSLDGKDLVGKFSTGYHTATMVPVFAYGPGAEEFIGIYENTMIFDKMVDLLDLK